MQNNLYFLKYKNYFNRSAKKLDTLSDYLEYSTGSIPNYNFNPNDGVNTIIDQIASVPDCDYVVVTKYVNMLETIDSRWFIIEAKREANNYYRLQI